MLLGLPFVARDARCRSVFDAALIIGNALRILSPAL